MRLGTLFSGIGAPEQGAIRVYGDDLDLVFACEWDKFARQSFKANYDIADDHFHTDINDMDGTQYRGKVDVIVGGSPCQDFSIAGLRAGAEGKRGQLIWQYFRIIEEVMPLIFIYENVKGFVSDKNGKTLKDFLEVFRTIGYNCHHDVVNTKDYGVPQNRERIYIVGFLDADMYYRFQFSPKQKLIKRLRDVLESQVEEKYYLSHKMIEYISTKAHLHQSANQMQNGNECRTLNATDYKCPPCIKVNEGVVGMLDIKGNESIRRVYGVDGNAPCLQTMQGGMREPKIKVKSATKQGYELALVGDNINLSMPKSETIRGRVGKQVAQTLDCACNQAVIEPMIYDDYNQKLKTDGIACTLTLNCGASAPRNGQKVVFPFTESEYRIRKLTPRECLRLQDFPDTFKQVVSDSQMYKQAGNSMSVNILEMIFNQIEDTKKSKNSLF